MCTLNYKPMYYVWMFRRLQDSGPKLRRVQQRPGWFMLIYSRFTWTLKTVNTRIRNTKHYSTTCILTNIDCLDNKWQIIWKTIANNLCDYTINDQWNEWQIKHKSHEYMSLRDSDSSNINYYPLDILAIIFIYHEVPPVEIDHKSKE